MTSYHFTERVRVVFMNSRQEASRLHHEYVGTEHLLLALLRDTPETVAGQMLRNLAVDRNAVRKSIEEVVKQGKADVSDVDSLPYTSRAKRVLELAMTEARELNHNYVGTEHLLLGLVREEKGIAAQALANAGVTLESARATALPIHRERGVEGGVPTASLGSASSGQLRLVPTPRTSPYQIAFVSMWWTLGIVVLGGGLATLIRQLNGAAPLAPLAAVLAGAEIVGASLFLFPRTLKYGALILLGAFAIAIVSQLVAGAFPAQLLVYAAATHFVLVQRTTRPSRITGTAP